MSFLLHWPLWASALLVYALFLAVALGLVFVVGRWVRRQPARETVVGGLVPPVGAAMTAGFLVWMALLANTEVRDIDDAERAVHAEAAALHALGVLGSTAAPAAAAGWNAQLADYAQRVLAHEWPRMAQGGDDGTSQQLDRLRTESLTRCAAESPELRAGLREGVQALATRFMRQPQTVTIKETHAPEQIRQLFIEVTETQRLHAVSLLLKHHRPVSTLAFCNTKQQCRDLVAVLQAQGISALELHGDLDQRDRDQVLVRFANRSCSVLVATDVAARGLDIAQLEAVINVDISPEVEVHTHRVGRTGRAGETGVAVSLASMDEMGRVGNIEHAQGRAFEWLPLAALQAAEDAPPPLPPMVTLQILGGRKEKIRAGDVLGALTKDLGLDGAQIGKISINEFSTYVAVAREIAPQALRGLSAGKVKGRSVKVRQL